MIPSTKPMRKLDGRGMTFGGMIHLISARSTKCALLPKGTKSGWLNNPVNYKYSLDL